MLNITHTLLLAGVFFSHLATTFAFWEEIRCTTSPDSGHTGDCAGALNLLPYGPYFDPANPGDRERPSKIFDVHMDYSWRNRHHISLPAAFRSGSCVILIQRLPSSITIGSLTPERAASAMYVYVWPKIRELVPKIHAECPLEAEKHNMGLTIARIKLETQGKFRDLYAGYLISVRAAPKDLATRRGGKQNIGSLRTLYTVYESSVDVGD